MDDEKRFNSLSSLRQDFNNFLFALVGEDQNGLDLSVNSALARSNVDPWEEAAALTELSHDLAMQRLTTLIAALPDGASRRADPETIAARLIALLPRHASRSFAPNIALPSAKSRWRLIRLPNIDFRYFNRIDGWRTMARIESEARNRSGTDRHAGVYGGCPAAATAWSRLKTLRAHFVFAHCEVTLERVRSTFIPEPPGRFRSFRVKLVDPDDKSQGGVPHRLK